MEHVAVRGLEHLERDVEGHDLRGYEGHVVAVGDLAFADGQHDRVAVLVEACEHGHVFDVRGRVPDMEVAVGVGLDAEVGFGDVLTAFDAGYLQGPVAGLLFGDHDVAVVALDLGLVARLGVQYRAVLRVVADRLLALRRLPGFGVGHRGDVRIVELPQEERVVLDEFDQVGAVAAGDVRSVCGHLPYAFR